MDMSTLASPRLTPVFPLPIAAAIVPPTLPALPECEAPAPAVVRVATRTIVFVIDQDLQVQSRAAEALKSAGYESHCFRDADAAAAFADGLPPQLIIADVLLAGASGIEACEQLRSEHHLDRVPLMYLSSSQAPDIIRRSHQGGSAYHLRKPFEPQVLLELVSKAIVAR